MRTLKILLFNCILATFLAAGVMTGCAGNTFPTYNEADLRGSVITLSRTMCYGTCPVYSLKISGDGTVVYNGEKFVRVTGKQETAISDEKIRQLVAEFAGANYFSLKDSYVEISVTDLPYVTTSITLGGKMKTIKHYLGDFGAPKGLTALETRIDEIVNTDQWIK
jgi:hypothetical protein